MVLYWDRYGKRRRKSKDTKVRSTKKTNWKWKIKFHKRANQSLYELVPCGSQIHNHMLKPILMDNVPDFNLIFGDNPGWFAKDDQNENDLSSSEINMFDTTFASFSQDNLNDFISFD